MLKIHETTTASGELEPVFLSREGATLAIVSSGASRPLPDGALEAVMKRFGAPLEPGEKLTEVGSLELDEGSVLRHMRHLARYDVIARDYLVHETPGQEALCALATTVAGALAHLAKAKET